MSNLVISRVAPALSPLGSYHLGDYQLKNTQKQNLLKHFPVSPREPVRCVAQEATMEDNLLFKQP